MANRIHIALFGRTNSGKSSFINAVTGQTVSLVSEIRGTTTDPVYKAMELSPLGAVVWIDTAGLDDETELGRQRVQATRRVIDKTDIAVVLFAEEDFSSEAEWIALLRKHGAPIVPLVHKLDEQGREKAEAIAKRLHEELQLSAVLVSSKTGEGLEEAVERIVQSSAVERERSICGHLVDEGDVVLLVMPQDIQAPKGRLIMPQVQTIRDLLDHRCIVLSVGADQLPSALNCLKSPPALMITDSQIFPRVRELKPAETELTSFSVLFSKYKGDIEIFLEGAHALGNLRPGDRVLIAEACTHQALDGDIARVKLPNLLRKNYGEVEITIVSGANFPEDLTGYSVIIHCGACMFNRKYVMSRIESAQEFGVPITNYGLAIAYMNKMMDSITY